MSILDQNEETTADFNMVLKSGDNITTKFYGRYVTVFKAKPNDKCMCDDKALFIVSEMDGDSWFWCGKCGDGGG